MGFLENLFGGGKKYPPLEANTSAAKKLECLKDQLEELSKKVNDPMEVVPADDSAFVFIGNPPKNFGMAWVEGGKMYNFKTLSEEKGIQQKQLVKLVEDLADAYKRNDSAERYSTKIGEKVVTVTPSTGLATEVSNIIANA
jgi:hypothetical protein